jgi:hypothetical protein
MGWVAGAGVQEATNGIVSRLRAILRKLRDVPLAEVLENRMVLSFVWGLTARQPATSRP